VPGFDPSATRFAVAGRAPTVPHPAAISTLTPHIENALVGNSTSGGSVASLAAMKPLLIATALVLSACSVSGEISIGGQSTENLAEDFIEDELAEQIGLGDLTASCSEPSSEDVGTTFLCTADTEDGRTIEFNGLIEEDGPQVRTTNLVLAEHLPAITSTILGDLEEQTGLELPEGALDCGTETLVVDSSNQVVCSVTDPIGEVFDTVVTFHGLESDDPTFDWEVITER
jgi:hypothetical protein